MKDDTISRQAVIDVLGVGKEVLSRVLRVLDDTDAAVRCEREKYLFGLGLIEAYINDMKELPAAQSEEIALHESCTDCPLYDKDRHRCPRFNKVIPETLRELQSAQPEHPKGKWIPVTRIYKATKDEFPDMHIEWVDSTEPDEIDGLRCSECSTVYDFTEARNWCSECGADMRGKQE